MCYPDVRVVLAQNFAEPVQLVDTSRTIFLLLVIGIPESSDTCLRTNPRPWGVVRFSTVVPIRAKCSSAGWNRDTYRMKNPSLDLPVLSHHKIAILGNFLPRQCGIATFTSDLTQALKGPDSAAQVDVIAMNDLADYAYPPCVRRQICADDYGAYRPAADFLNRGDYEVLSVQHEYGIFGGEAGAYLLTLLREVKMPIVTTLHTVLREPTPAQRAVTNELLQLSERVVVMSHLAVEILTSQYGLGEESIDMIPHGIPDFTKSGPSHVKEDLGIHGPMIFTFGLLSPDKGIQYAIEAMPQILAEAPDAVYVVLGATHPNIRAISGETYRDSLASLAERLGVRKSIRFIDRFVTRQELVEYLAAADIYITPYLNPEQITSGTLAYALGAGKAVISTPYLYAKELLADGRGIIVPFRDAVGISASILKLQSQDGLSQQMALSAASFSSKTLWPEIGKRYQDTFAKALAGSASKLRMLTDLRFHTWTDFTLPVLSTDHLSAMTDDTGMLQHATFTIPHRLHGYCVDDNARALLLTSYLEGDRVLSPHLLCMQGRYLAFVCDSFNPDNGRFRNFMSYSRQWLEDQGSDDSHARTLWSLAAVAHRSSSPGYRSIAHSFFRQGSPAVYAMNSPRSWAYAVLASDEFLHAVPNDRKAYALRDQMAHRLWREYQICRTDDWRWFEDVVSYANARMSQALIVAGQWAGNHGMLEAGLESLAWLMDHQTGPNGLFTPIGSNGFWKRGQPKAQHDQQPLEAWASISACISAARATGSDTWITEAQVAFNWYLGGNELGEPLYDHLTGGCRDALHADRLNENQGAESTLSFLCSLTEIETALASPAVANTSEGSI